MLEQEKISQAPSATDPRYEALLEVVESIALHRDLPSLLQDLAQRLRHVVPFTFLALHLHDPVRDTVCLHVLETLQPICKSPPEELPAEEAPAVWVWQTQQPLWVPDVTTETRFRRMMKILRDHGARSACWLPLTTTLQRLGALAFGSDQASAYSECDLRFMEKVAQQVAVAVDNALNFQNAQSAQQQLARERDRLRLLLEINNSIVSNLDLRPLLRAISASLRSAMQCDAVGVWLPDADGHQMQLHGLDFPDGKGFTQEEMRKPIAGSLFGVVLRTGQPLVVGRPDIARLDPERYWDVVAEGFQSGYLLPLSSRQRILGILTLARRQEKAFTPEEVEFLGQIANQVAIAVENALSYQCIADLKNKLAEEKLYLEDEIRTEYNFEEIIGESPALKRILKQVETVAPTDSTVLILGESGTGKELIARALHDLSPRRERTFMKVNCAAIPTGLLESELFGHEKGAFTGAIAQRVGRFELAHKGTLFLDEIGDIPLELQAKLLRVLQEREFERLGSTRTVRVDVRLVTATNRDLAQMVSERQFREDLYYRLNVFPIQLPPLRERREDIPLLVRHFAQKHARRTNKRLETVPSEALQALSRYAWPGNIRELENFIERAVILSRGPVLQIPLAELRPREETPTPSIATLEEAERQHILQALRAAHGVIGGANGAAARLGLNRTTLHAKMRKLGITRQSY